MILRRPRTAASAPCALAAFDPASPRWETAGKPAAETLVAENPLLATAWMEALRPVRHSLLPALQTVFHDRERSDLQSGRWRAASWPTMSPTSPESWPICSWTPTKSNSPSLTRNSRSLEKMDWRVCTAEVDEKPLPDAPEETKEALARRQANAAVALSR